MNAFRRDRWSASSGGTHSLLGGQFAVYLRLISPYLSPVYRAASISYQRHINFMLTAARINTLFTTGLRPEAVACGPPAGGGMQGRKSLRPISEGFLFALSKRNPSDSKEKTALVLIVGGCCLLRASTCLKWSSRHRMGVQHRRPCVASLRSRH